MGHINIDAYLPPSIEGLALIIGVREDEAANPERLHQSLQKMKINVSRYKKLERDYGANLLELLRYVANIPEPLEQIDCIRRALANLLVFADSNRNNIREQSLADKELMDFPDRITSLAKPANRKRLLRISQEMVGLIQTSRGLDNRILTHLKATCRNLEDLLRTKEDCLRAQAGGSLRPVMRAHPRQEADFESVVAGVMKRTEAARAYLAR